MKIHPLPSLERLKHLFSLEEGTLVWRERPRSDFRARDRWLTWNKRFAGKRAGYVDPRGYLQVHVDHRKYWGHRIIFALAKEKLPSITELVDHIDDDPSNNAPDNFRLADYSTNCFNSHKRLTNRSGFKGVSPNGSGFAAQITLKGTVRHLGTFATPEAAHAAYVAASEQLHGEFGRAG
jgi:HNH endonuclease